MKTYTGLRTLYGKLTKNTSTTNLATGDELMNDEYRALCALRDWPWLHRLRTATTAANTTAVPLASDVDQVESVYVTVGSTRHSPKPAPSRQFWDELHYTTQTSDTPEYWFVDNGQIGLWPRPATAGNIITTNAKVRVRDLSVADITSTTIAAIANGAVALTVSAGLTVQMAGFWIRPTLSTTANTGDGHWYELASVTNATTATLARTYGGVSISAGTAAATIGQAPLLPENFHPALVWGAAADYWYGEGNSKKGDTFKALHDKKMSGLSQYASTDTSMVLDDGDDDEILNPNLTISL